VNIVKNRWYAVLSSAELGKKPVSTTRFSVPLVVWRDGEGVRAARDLCPHRGAKLSLGKVQDGCITCPFHGFAFDASGACTRVPAHPERAIPKLMALSMIPAREAHGLIWFFTGPETPSEDPIPFFDFGRCVYDGSEERLDIKVHYTRAIENQLDYAHLPFVHARTIGRFVSDPAHALRVEADGDHIRAHDEAGLFELLGPNIWHLRTGSMHQFLAFAPIDETTTRYYLRTYQDLIRVPPLAWVLGRISRALNRVIIKEDIAVLVSQPNEETRVKMEEVLVPSDGAIIAYRKWREGLRAPFAPPLRVSDDAKQKATDSRDL
jgi:phenylpropionate dioxygenase-like ring-hydroxylating dioxygenase large terminal subunit